MLNRLRNLFKPGTRDADDSGDGIAEDRLRTLLSHFRIGQKILYYPEYHPKSVLNTIILAYRVNGAYLYSNDAVRHRADGSVVGFRLSPREVLPVEQVHRFQMLLPDTSELERKLDYFTRAELGPAGHLRQGNTLTLVNDSTERCVPTVDAVIQRKQVMDEGPFEGDATILVTPEFASLKLNDKRRHQRIATDLWADLFYAPGAPPFSCVLKDFSETALRLGVSGRAEEMPALETGRMAAVEFDFGGVESTYRLRGRVIRRDAGNCVLQIEQILKDGEFGRIKFIDAVEIKTRLLNAGSGSPKD